jgi:hypothetical protein
MSENNNMSQTNNSSNLAKNGLPFLFGKENYIIMAVGLVVIIVGYMLMVGGKSPDPNVFNANEIYSSRRITIAPILVLLGLAIEAYAIMRKPKA